MVLKKYILSVHRKNNRIPPVRSTKRAKDSSYFYGSPVGGGEGPIPRKARTNTNKWRTTKNQFLSSIPQGVKYFPVPIGLTLEHDILVLKPSPCLHNGNEVDDWMGLSEWNSCFKSQVRDSNRCQDIMNLNKFHV
ncbi:uncharacterized protein TNCV_1278091 [Trichonephila clavipes]|nr:uncharacterized protein TNCV_1278091 [Trichonephila clavipes]